MTLTGCTDAYWHDLSDPAHMWIDAARTLPAAVGATVKVVDDQTGFGHHIVFDDGREPVLVETVGGYHGLNFDGTVVGKLGAPGDLRWPQVTTFATVTRDGEALGSDILIFAGRRSTDPATGGNGMYWLGFLDTQTLIYRTTNSSGSSSSGGGPRKVPLTVSHRSTDGTVRANKLQYIDGADVASIAYPRTTEQPLVGAVMNAAGDYINFYEGLAHCDAGFNVAVENTLRARIELQLARTGGV